MMSGVYAIVNTVAKKEYVGKSKNIKIRFNTHLNNLKKGNHPNKHLQADWNEYGSKAFIFTVREICPMDIAGEIEARYIQRFHHTESLYNISLFDGGGDHISNHPDYDAVCKRIAEGSKRWRDSLSPEERKLKLGSKVGPKNGMYGKTHTPEVKRFLSEINKGRPGTMKGRTHTKEAKQKLSEHAAKRVGELNPFYGKRHTRETLEILRQKKIGTIPTNARKVSVDGVTYDSATAASRALGVVPATILFRIKSKNYNYNYL